MFASVRRYRVESGSVDELLRKVKDELVPMLKRAKGYRGHYEIVADDGSVVAITGFDDRAGAQQANTLATKWAREKLAAIRVRPLDMSEGEVKLIDRA